MSEQFLVKFWGVRDSIPSPGPDTVRYGGNTACLEMQVGSQRLVFDGGTGLRVLGQAMMSQLPIAAHIFFTHFHWDHIQGFPFFVPAFVKGNQFHLYGAIAPNGDTIEQRLHDQMLQPNFPIPLEIMQADLQFHTLNRGKPLQLGEVTINTANLSDQDEAIGYRINWHHQSVVYISTTETFTPQHKRNILDLAHHANLLIINALSTQPESDPNYASWQEVVNITKAAQVEKLVISHHDPLHNDEFLDHLKDHVNLTLAGVIIAYEGLEIRLDSQPCTPSPAKVRA
jgi:phosphoribosyl 1,2-cyclic phosphodiesterase